MQEPTQVETKKAVTTESKDNETPVEKPNPPAGGEKKSIAKSVATQLAYFAEARVTCACGNKFTTGSTREEIRVEICNSCHPFFTGQEKFVDTEGRVERFKRMEDAKKETKTKKDVERKEDQPKTLKEMLLSLNDKKSS